MTFFFFNDTATTEIYTLSLHDALPICSRTADQGPVEEDAVPSRSRARYALAAIRLFNGGAALFTPEKLARRLGADPEANRSEEHTSELQSRQYLVCRLLLEKKKLISPT